jgi:CRISPR/Cas system-associated exonuclease Cas4 (RecB family)
MQRRGTSIPLLPGLQDENTDPGDAAAHLAEEACLFYVALTRARDELVLSRAEQYGRMRYKASPFLAPIVSALGERLHRDQWPPARQAVRRPVVAGNRSLFALPERVIQEPVRHSEIEMYQRCPRQYAYRYVYKLQPREIGLATLRHVLHAALHRLQQSVTRTRSGRRKAAAAAKEISLQEALKLFDHEWDKKLEQERLGQSERDEGGAERSSAVSSGVSGDAFLEVYRRHGRQVIERAWKSMTEYRALERSHDGQLAPGVIFENPETHYDEQVTIQVRGRELSVVLDRVERGTRAADTAGTSTPVRLVRHRLGNSNNLGKPDLHALFYALAAEAERGDTRATELYSHNLTTGEVERVILDDRKLARLREELDTALEGIDSGFYPPRPDPNICPNCPFLLICPA